MHTLKTWSTTQQIIALSSGEAEPYAMVKRCAQAKGLCSILRDLGFDAEARISSDASAALGMAHRQGLGRTRHIDVQYLWIQNEVANGTVHTRKVETTSNPKDLFTKCLPSWRPCICTLKVRGQTVL